MMLAGGRPIYEASASSHPISDTSTRCIQHSVLPAGQGFPTLAQEHSDELMNYGVYYMK